MSLTCSDFDFLWIFNLSAADSCGFCPLLGWKAVLRYSGPRLRNLIGFTELMGFLNFQVQVFKSSESQVLNNKHFYETRRKIKYRWDRKIMQVITKADVHSYTINVHSHDSWIKRLICYKIEGENKNRRDYL